MANRHGADIGRLQKRVSALSTALARLGDRNDFIELIKILRRPGWTTPAEFIFTLGIVESMLAHAGALSQLKGQLLKGSQAVIAE